MHECNSYSVTDPKEGKMGAQGNAIFAQSGGPTAVINSSICGAIQEALKHKEISAMYGSLHGILGVLNETMIDLNRESRRTIELLRQTPSSSLGSSRHKICLLYT